MLTRLLSRAVAHRVAKRLLKDPAYSLNAVLAATVQDSEQVATNEAVSPEMRAFIDEVFRRFYARWPTVEDFQRHHRQRESQS